MDMVTVISILLASWLGVIVLTGLILTVLIYFIGECILVGDSQKGQGVWRHKLKVCGSSLFYLAVLFLLLAYLYTTIAEPLTDDVVHKNMKEEDIQIHYLMKGTKNQDRLHVLIKGEERYRSLYSMSQLKEGYEYRILYFERSKLILSYIELEQDVKQIN